MRASRFWGCTIGYIVPGVRIRGVRSKDALAIVCYVQRIPFWEIKSCQELFGNVTCNIADLVSHLVELVGSIVKSTCATTRAIAMEAVQDVVINTTYDIEAGLDSLTRFGDEGSFPTKKVPSEVRDVDLRLPSARTVSGQATYG